MNWHLPKYQSTLQAKSLQTELLQSDEHSIEFQFSLIVNYKNVCLCCELWFLKVKTMHVTCMMVVPYLFDAVPVGLGQVEAAGGCP